MDRASSPVRAWIRLLRPWHWLKNGFVLTGLLFGHAYHEPAMVWAALGATLAFCFAASAVYAFNDCMDRDHDRAHPDKRQRPVASGEIAPRAALGASAGLAAAGLLLAAAVAIPVAAIVAAYLAQNVAYSMGLKRVPVLDVFLIASGFMLRVLAGTAGIGIEPSRWLLACVFLLTLFLGFGKRRAERSRLAEVAATHRAVLGRYGARFLDRAILICATAMLVTYALYTIADSTVALHGTTRLVLTLPFVLLGTMRYLYLLHYRGSGGDPVDALLRDPLLAASACGWLGTVIWLIA